MNKTRTFVAVIVSLVIAGGVLAFGWIKSNARVNYFSTALESNYQRSFNELVNNVNTIEINMSKALISKDDKKKKELYQKINQQCLQASNNLSNLPINHESIVETTKFVNQLGGFSYYLSQKLNVGDVMTEADTTSINDLYNWCVYVQSVINDYAKNVDADFNILNNTISGNVDTEFDKMFANTSATGTDYPTLIYDGPFSDSIRNKEVKGLLENEISVNEAIEKLQNCFNEYNLSNLQFNGEVNGKFSGYNFSFDTKNRKYYAEITKKGGMLLSVASSGVLKEETIKIQDAEFEAENFAKKLGLKNMKSVWSSNLNGVAYVNLTPVVDNIIYYPDMIKAKVSLDTGSILGWEAQSYAYNHVDRENLDFIVDESNARKMVDARLSILSIKKCIIPQEYGTEQLCYEYKCTYNSYTYYVYISAKTGQEVNTLRVIKTSNGNLLQ